MEKKLALILSIVLTAALFLTGCQAGDYKNAMSLYESGSFQEAAASFRALGDYKNSAEMVNVCRYEAAKSLYNAGSYEEAKKIFQDLGTYSNSSEYAAECDYYRAAGLFEAGEYEEAASVYESLRDFRDSADRLADARKKAAEAAEAARPRKTVTVTMQNWSQYFEIVQIPVRDSFDELYCLAYVFRPKNSVLNRIDYNSSFSVDVKYSYKTLGTFRYEFDARTNSLTIGSIVSKYTFRDSSSYSFSNYALSMFLNKDYEKCCYSGDIPFFIGGGVSETRRGRPVVGLYEITIDGIKGSIILYDN